MTYEARETDQGTIAVHTSDVIIKENIVPEGSKMFWFGCSLG
jgi:hypothetical protein